MRLLGEAKADEARQRTTDLAFVGWQFYTFQPRMSAKERRVDFPTYLRNLGLDAPDAPRSTTSKEEALALAERIRQADKAARATPDQEGGDA